jgi:hypothetical protein
MSATEVIAGRVTRVVTCILCGADIPVGEWAVYFSTPPKGSAHVRCHTADRGRR